METIAPPAIAVLVLVLSILLDDLATLLSSLTVLSDALTFEAVGLPVGFLSVVLVLDLPGPVGTFVVVRIASDASANTGDVRSR